MFQLLINLMIIMSSFLFLQMNHPLAMGLMLLIQTFLICLTTGILSKSFWFSYILFLVFMGGMLVLFIYVTSLASNEMFSLSVKVLSYSIIMILMTSSLMMVMDMNMMTSIFENNEMESIGLNNLYMKENTVMLNKIYNYPTNFLTLILINYLLITLIITVKITNMFYGPLRQMN
uniref:NADH-ubiquinone oxidoreductase chain 6 n=1 Tax=Argyra pingwuensis TaxID=2762466 RepID=A0A7G6KSD0_9MUSC|nr:NADH dehydrogenase subunit 6 [Argyra pingwuensis]QNC71312.1 NADH dehydrogenase subunit 6 [Argyra pingwuensis]